MRERTPYQRIGVPEAVEILSQPDAVVFDVRDPRAYAEAHMEGAKHLTFSALGEVIGAVAKSKPVVIYCYHGNASQEYAQALSDFGFAKVYSLDGGYEAWENWEKAGKGGGEAAALPETVQSWLEGQGFPAGSGLTATLENRMTPLMKACAEGVAPMVGELIAAGADVNATNGDGNNSLWLACVGNHLDIIDMLIAAGIDMDSRNDNGATALMYSASAGKGPVVAHLLARGADIKAETLDGFTAMDLAATEECLNHLRLAYRKAKAAASA